MTCLHISFTSFHILVLAHYHALEECYSNITYILYVHCYHLIT